MTAVREGLRRMTRQMWRRATFMLFVYLAIALFLLRPVFHLPATTVPTGSSKVATVPLLNMWIIWWNCEQAECGFSGYWDAPIFHPATGTFAYSEPQPLTLLLWPILKVTGSLVCAYKVWLLAAFTLNGFVAWLVLRDVRMMRAAAFCGGLMMQSLPTVYYEIDAIQLCHVWSILLTIRCGLLLLGTPSRMRAWPSTQLRADARKRSVVASKRSAQDGKKFFRKALTQGLCCGISFSIAFLICIHQTLLLTLALLPVALFVTVRSCLTHRSQRTRFTAIVVAVLTATALTGPFAWAMHSVLKRQGFERSATVVKAQSADWRDYLQSGEPLPQGGRSLSPGLITLGLCVAGILTVMWRRRRLAWMSLLLTLMLTAVVLSLGSKLQLFGFSPWHMLRAYIPGVSAIRNVHRFALIAHASAVLIAALGLHNIMIVVRRFWPKDVLPGTLVLCLPVVMQAVPPTMPLVPVPDHRQAFAWVRFLATEADAEHTTLCLPMATDSSVGALHCETLWMFHATRHRSRLCNGYSGFFPARVRRLSASVNTLNTFADEKLFRTMGIDWIVVDNRWKSSAEMLHWAPFATSVFHDDASEVTVYRMLPKPPPTND